MPLTIQVGSAGSDDIGRAADIARGGGIAVFPTETVYGMGADIRLPSAVEGVARLKHNPPDKPLLVHCCSLDQLEELVAAVPQSARTLMDEFWPGPLALVLAASPSVPPIVTGGTGTVGIRMVSHQTFMQFCTGLGAPLAGTSANMHGDTPPHRFSDLNADLLAGTDIALDAGDCGSGRPSTVVDLTCSPPRLLRTGAVAPNRVEEVLGLPLGS